MSAKVLTCVEPVAHSCELVVEGDATREATTSTVHSAGCVVTNCRVLMVNFLSKIKARELPLLTYRMIPNVPSMLQQVTVEGMRTKMDIVVVMSFSGRGRGGKSSFSVCSTLDVKLLLHTPHSACGK